MDLSLKPISRLHRCKEFLIAAGVNGVRVESEFAGDHSEHDRSRGVYVEDTIDIPSIDSKTCPVLILGYGSGFGMNVHPGICFADIFLSPTEKSSPMDNAAYMRIGRAAEEYGIMLHPDMVAVIEEVAANTECRSCKNDACHGKGVGCAEYHPKAREQFVYKKA